MERNGFLTVIFLFFILVDRSNASYSIWGLRKLITATPNASTPTQLPPLPSPVSSGKEPKASPTNADKSGDKKPKDPQLSNDSGKTNPKSSNKDGNNVTAPPQKQVDSEKNHKGRDKSDGKPNSQSGSEGSCEGSSEACRVQDKMTACIRSLGSGSKGLVLLVQNEGESTLKVNVTVSISLKNVTEEHEIPKNQTERVNISSAVGQSIKILLKAGDKECVLHLAALSQWSFLQQLPAYYKQQITPIYIAYFFFLVALMVGGTCACCQFRKRRRQDEVPYQELEMGLPKTDSTIDVESAEGWDEGWDDDWDDDKAVKSPGGRGVGNISANGLTVRSSNRDGWGKDRDD